MSILRDAKSEPFTDPRYDDRRRAEISLFMPDPVLVIRRWDQDRGMKLGYMSISSSWYFFFSSVLRHLPRVRERRRKTKLAPSKARNCGRVFALELISKDCRAEPTGPRAPRSELRPAFKHTSPQTLRRPERTRRNTNRTHRARV